MHILIIHVLAIGCVIDRVVVEGVVINRRSLAVAVAVHFACLLDSGSLSVSLWVFVVCY